MDRTPSSFLGAERRHKERIAGSSKERTSQGAQHSRQGAARSPCACWHTPMQPAYVDTDTQQCQRVRHPTSRTPSQRPAPARGTCLPIATANGFLLLLAWQPHWPWEAPPTCRGGASKSCCPQQSPQQSNGVDATQLLAPPPPIFCCIAAACNATMPAPCAGVQATLMACEWSTTRMANNTEV